MNFKLDENFGTRTQQLFRDAGYEVQTVRDQGLQGRSDKHFYEVCCAEQRCLVTLDLDFADVIRFPPTQASGIVVIRVPRNPSLALLEQLIRQFLHALIQMPIENKLWIVEVGRIRTRQSE
ncbi:DUF5615 family PIN-like protein [Dehalococcoidia bacterium]|nr:DUF5615 family PIN-like protein [Dehalococcoidia bacterium]MCL0076751.1 DUF5615 family PIN-like protein [Dehalococcoidia bacterium]MCL0082560.1 DUF5615 family PIN-like protein [Dehalococcoidia bacterium]MCL0084392.1 DUF5615 family PIN-like protein [Dehalococcoidia bacterium]